MTDEAESVQPKYTYLNARKNPEKGQNCQKCRFSCKQFEKKLPMGQPKPVSTIILISKVKKLVFPKSYSI